MPRRYRPASRMTCVFSPDKGHTPDENEAFIYGHLCDYLKNLVGHFSAPDKDFLEMAAESLGTETWQLADQCREILPPDAGIAFKEEMTETCGDLDEVADVLFRFFVATSAKVRRAFLKRLYAALEQRSSKLARTGESLFAKNIQALSKMLGLTEIEQKMLVFLVIVSFSESAECYFVNHLQCHNFPKRHILASALGISRPQLDGLFQGRLPRLGLFDDDLHRLSMSDDYRKLFENPDADSLPDMLYGKVSSDAIPLDSHLLDRKDLDHAVRLLDNEGKSASHLLLYGPPGTGKTSFARSVCRSLNSAAYEILHSDENDSRRRRMAISACSNMLRGNKKAVIIVDESDNLLNTQSSWFFRGEVADKGWLNRLMDSSGPNFIWIVNSTEHIEPSVLRRFAFSIPFNPFGRSIRTQVLGSVLEKHGAEEALTPAQVKELAACFNVNAGPMDTAVKKALEMGINQGEEFYNTVSRSLFAYERLVNDGFAPPRPRPVEKTYDLDGLTIEGDVAMLMKQLEAWAAAKAGNQANFGARLLFYGPPGTGKSETAKYIATLLNRELIVKSASDIINPYVGMTERAIREAFENAAREDAVLVFDEADSFLFPRSQAQRSWEISFTNEFLAQMERYCGILICTTNRFMDMDEASVRRFTHKLGFDFLLEEATLGFYKRMLAPLSGKKAPAIIWDQIRAIKRLTPGDFAAVRDRFRFFAKSQVRHEDLVEGLKNESKAKFAHSGEKVVGF